MTAATASPTRRRHVNRPPAERGARRTTADETSDGDHQHGVLPALMAVAFLVKAAVLFELGDHPLLQPQGELDGTHYVQLARTMASGGPLAIGEALYVSPTYVYFLAAVFRTGGDLAAARLIQIALGTAAVGLLYLTARQWYGRRAALVAGVLAILTGLFTFYEVLILQAALDPFLVACALYFVSRSSADHRRAPSALAGLTTGLLILNRPNALPYGLLVIGWLGLAAVRGGARVDTASGSPAPGSSPRGPWNAMVAAAIYATSLGLLVAGNGLRNYLASGETVLIASHGGLNFYIGNSAGADGTYQALPGITPSIVGQLRDATREAEAEAGRALTATEVSDVFYQRAWRWIASEPGAAARLLARKLVLVLHRANVPLNYSYQFYRRDESMILRWLFIGAWLLVPLGLTGLLVPALRARQEGFWTWASFVPVYTLTVAVFFVSSRYRMPLLMPLCAAAGAATAGMFDRVRAREFRGLVVPAACLAAAGVVVFWPLRVDEGLGGERTRKAVWLVEQGHVDEAERYVASVAATHSHPGALHFKVGEAMATAGHFAAAIDHYRKAIAIDGARPALELPLGQALVVAGRAANAVPYLAAAFDAGYRRDIGATWLVRALALDGQRDRAVAIIDALPDDVAAARVETAADLGALALQLDAPDRALRWWRLAAARTPDRAEAHEALGTTLLLLGDEAAALGPLETACRLDPASASARMNLALALARTGRVGDALVHARLAKTLAPDEPRIANLLDMLTRGARR